MSAFGGKADMTVCGGLLSRSLLGVKQTCRIALHMSAFDPKRTSQHTRPTSLRKSVDGNLRDELIDLPARSTREGFHLANTHLYRGVQHCPRVGVEANKVGVAP